MILSLCILFLNFQGSIGVTGFNTINFSNDSLEVTFNSTDESDQSLNDPKITETLQSFDIEITTFGPCVHFDENPIFRLYLAQIFEKVPRKVEK